MAPLPPEWKTELIDNAVSASAERKASRVVTLRKPAFGVLAACWVATAVLHMTTPTVPGFSGEAIAGNSELDPNDLSIVAASFSRPPTTGIDL